MTIERDPHDLAETLFPAQATNGSLTAIPSGIDKSKARDLTVFQSQSLFADRIHVVGGKMLRTLPEPSTKRVSVRFKKTMRMDPPISLGLKTLKAPIRNVEWWVDGQDRDIAAFNEEVIKLHQKSLSRKALRAVDFGWQVCEWVWGRQTIRVDNERLKVHKTFRDAFVPIHFIDLDPQYIEPVLDEKIGIFAGVKPIGTFEDREKIIPRWKLFYTANEPEYGDPRGHSILDDVYPVYYWCQLAHLMAARYFESRAIPNPVVRCPATETIDPTTGQRAQNVNVALSAADNLRHGKPAVMPSDIDQDARLYLWTMELLQSDKRGDEFKDYIAFLNDLKMMGLGIPPKVLLQGSGVGTFAETREITTTWSETQETLLDDLWVEPINDQLIPMLTVLNFGQDAEQPRFETEGFKRTDQALIARVIDKMFEAKHRLKKASGETVDVSLSELIEPAKLLRSLRIAQKDVEELEVAPQAEDKQLEAQKEIESKKIAVAEQKAKTSGPSGEKRRDEFTEN